MMPANLNETHKKKTEKKLTLTNDVRFIKNI